jgi:GLPGLI family protein
MKRFILFSLFLFSITTIAQNISGQAYYQSKTTVNMDEFGGRDMDESRKKMIAERMKGMLEKTYILTFNNSESIYKEEEKLETMGNSGGGFRMMMGSFSPENQYKNIKTQVLIQEQEFFGKQFLINDSIPQLEWTLEKESKQIGQYVVFKATAIKKVDANDLSMMRRRVRNNDQKKDSLTNDESKVKNDSIKDKNPITEIEVPREVVVTAWYTPMIPVQNGPGEYSGLPGLILELNVFRTTILCSKIVLNPKEGEVIKILTKGKEVTKKEYNKIVKEKTDEMRENFRGGGRRGGRRFGGS